MNGIRPKFSTLDTHGLRIGIGVEGVKMCAVTAEARAKDRGFKPEPCELVALLN